ncbi:hypothetical protein [uncultured Eudoraea sp.]|uniref:hypothetical protein n=1 Tax=uncultured Eudoraea sp. TaxID=1035614 RepID=UPI0026117793|nr:hypothetical protein [uncultured Eudoraea sp.]
MGSIILKNINVLVRTFYYLNANQVPVNRYFILDGLSELVTILLLFCVTLIVVVTPLLLIFFWIYYSKEYVKKYRNNEGLTEHIMENGLSKNEGIKSAKIPYIKTYSRMFGFGLSIIAYSLSSNVYMFLTFSEYKEALINYFSFPFKVFSSFRIFERLPENSIPLTDVWKAMLLIVAISAVVFFVGFFMGKIIATAKLQEKPQTI